MIELLCGALFLWVLVTALILWGDRLGIPANFLFLLAGGLFFGLMIGAPLLGLLLLGPLGMAAAFTLVAMPNLVALLFSR